MFNQVLKHPKLEIKFAVLEFNSRVYIWDRNLPWTPDFLQAFL